MLGKPDDAARFRGHADRIKAGFRYHFVTASGRVVGDSQTADLLALAFDLVDGQTREAVAKHLVEDIERRGVLTTGFVGVNLLLPTPSPEHGITSANATFDSIHGRIALRWTLSDDGILSLDATIPPNTTVILHSPNHEQQELHAGTHSLKLMWSVR